MVGLVGGQRPFTDDLDQAEQYSYLTISLSLPFIIHELWQEIQSSLNLLKISQQME